MRRTQIYLDADQDRRLARRAAASGVTKSLLIREAVETYLSTPDEDARLAQFRAAIDAAAGAPVDVEGGAAYVERVRGVDAARDGELDARRR